MGRTDPVSRRTRPAKAALSKDAVVDAALALLDRDGLEALTMRRVAVALDTGPASLYVYVENRDQLIALVLDRVVGEVRLPSAETGGNWREQLVSLISECVAVLGRHRGIAVTAFANVPTGPNSLTLLEAMLSLLVQSGMSRQACAWAVDLVALYITAAGTEQTVYAEYEDGGAKSQEVNPGLRGVFAGLSPSEFPHTTDLHAELTYGSSAQRASWSIDVLINGILATAPATTAPATPPTTAPAAESF